MAGRAGRTEGFNEAVMCPGGCGRLLIPRSWEGGPTAVVDGKTVDCVVHAQQGLCARCVSRVRNGIPTHLSVDEAREHGKAKRDATYAAKHAARDAVSEEAASSFAWRTDLNPYERVVQSHLRRKFNAKDRVELALMLGLAYRGEDSITRW